MMMMKPPSPHRSKWIFLAATVLLSSLLAAFVEGFVPQKPCAFRRTFSSFLAAKENENEEDDWNVSDDFLSKLQDNMEGPEKSQMFDFISDYVKRENPSQDNDSNPKQQQHKYTHLIAVPMGSCHELAIELESVQRAILYHCPVLVHACLVPATTRLPLLYVDAPSQKPTKEATEELGRIVQEVVQKHIFVPSTIEQEKKDDDDDIPLDGPNADGIRPLTLTFQSLEMDGAKNDALHTVALPDDPGTVRLQSLVAELQQTIATRLNWETSVPPDDHIVNESDGPPVFRPRVPFMRLPANFKEFLDPLPDGIDEICRTSEQGGNGISPIFWSTWWDDVFGTARLREIGVYPRSQQSEGGLEETAFHIPQQLTPLPDGNAALTQQEAKFESYQDQRLKQAEYDVQKDQEERRGLAESENSPDDVMLAKTRERLEALYENDIQELEEANLVNKDDSLEETFKEDPARPKVDASLLDDWTQERIRKANAARGIAMYDEDEELEEEQAEEEDGGEDQIVDATIEANGKESGDSISEESTSNDTPTTTSFDDAHDQLDDSISERISTAVDSLEFVKAQASLAADKDKVPIKDNPVFEKYKDGTLYESRKPDDSDYSKDLDPFPARDHFVGFWEVMNSPTGFPPDDDGGDGSKSENLILRVDGTTAGGPILDPETQQKAAGGTWKVTPNEDGDESSANLRIRLVIPPEKERILVMQGTAVQGPLFSLNNVPPMASSTFGVPMFEEKARKAREAAERELGDLVDKERIKCTGKVWLEDAITGKNKMEIGEFSLLKLNTPRDPKQYTITIPRNVRNQD